MSDKYYFRMIDTVIELLIEYLTGDPQLKNEKAQQNVVKTLLKLRVETLKRLNS